MVLCASPAYVAQSGRVRTPNDLVHHPWVSITQLPHAERVTLRHRDGRRQTLRVHPAVKTNTGIAARSFLLDGVGIGLVPDYAVAKELASGALVELLPEWREASDRPISAVYPGGIHLPMKIRLLVDFLKAEFRAAYG
jgi:DNA-binding transcriptional LysR family regulator